MLKSYLKVALRTLRKQKVVSAVTIGSLAVGLACCLLLFLYVKREWTYDRFHAGADRIFRVVKTEEAPNGDRTRSAIGPPYTGPALVETFPEIEEAVRFYKTDVSVSHGDQTFAEQEIILADSTLFDVFSGFALRHGSEQTALEGPGDVLLSPGAAQKFFGEENPMGRALTIQFRVGTLEATVAGVIEPPPNGSSIPFAVVTRFDNFLNVFPAPVRQSPLAQNIGVARTYVRVSTAADVDALEERVAEFLAERKANESGFSVGGDELAGHELQPLAEVHLDPSVTGGLAAAGDPAYSYVLAGIALLVLVLACINFMTLSLGRSAGRAREVGIRKAAGARREQVAFQFWGEALLTTGFALVLGVLLARAALPGFNRLTQQELQFDFFGSPSLWLALGVLVAVVGCVAGGYPAWVLSRFAPSPVLRGRTALGGRSRGAQALVVVQFALSIALVAGLLIMSSQLRYATNTDLGYKKDRIVAVEASDGVVQTKSGDDGGTESDQGRFYERFRQQALAQTGIEGVASTFFGFPDGGLPSNLQLGDTAKVRAQQNPVSPNFTNMMGIDVVAGRSFRRGEDATDGVQPALVNEALVRAMGWLSPQAALGKRLPTDALITLGEEGDGLEVVGVVEDFHSESMHDRITPYIFTGSSVLGGGGRTALVELGPDTEGALASLEAVWQNVAPEDAPFKYEFLSDVVREQYASERRWRALAGYAAGLALLISCAGLFGLALLSVRRREKEIGIRKVLGASALDVTALVAKQFALLVAAGFALAVPLAWLGARRWLETFAYRIDLGAGPFLVAGVAVLAVAMATVGYQALRAARANPVDALRQE